MKYLTSLLFLAFVAATVSADERPAGPRIEVNGLLGDKAVIMVDGERRLVATGEATPEGVELIEVEGEGVRLNVDGEEQYIPLGSTRVGTRYSTRDNVQERVYRDRGGMFRTDGSINGVPVMFLVDTGASTVAMGVSHAKRLGLDYKSGKQVTVQTASGTAGAWHIVLDQVSVGQIKLNNIDGVVIEKNISSQILLGMSFLDRLKIQREGEVMVLEMNY